MKNKKKSLENKTKGFFFLLGFKPVHHCGVSQAEKRNFEEQRNHRLSR